MKQVLVMQQGIIAGSDGLPRAIEDVSLSIPDNIKTIKGKITKKAIVL